MASSVHAARLALLLATIATACWTGTASAAAPTAEHKFIESNGAYPGGAEPAAGLTPVGTAFYGTTSRGGDTRVNGYGGGVAFKLVKSGTAYAETVLHAFTGEADGLFPGAGNLLVDATDHVYGTTAGWVQLLNEGGGTCGANGNLSCDTVFELTPSGKKWDYALVHRFTGGADGYDPQGGLIRDKSGALYGTTMFGGNKGCTQQQPEPMSGCGTVFRLVKSGSTWTKTVLHVFTGGADGSLPAGALVEDPSGNGVLYGTASSGGAISRGGNICEYGAYCGVIFKLTPTAKAPWKETVLYSFQGTTDGASPISAMTLKDGVLYGTTSGGGDYNGYGCGAYGGGSVFALTIATKKFRALYDFQCGSDGGLPQGNVALDAAGNVYGTTSSEGKYYNSVDCDSTIGCGTVFKLAHRDATPWVESHLYDFSANGNGGWSLAGLVMSGDRLWGTTRLGGAPSCGIDPFTAGCGVVFSIAP